MTGLHHQVLTHLARRSVASFSNGDVFKQSLEEQAQAYEDSPYKDVNPAQVGVVIVTFIIFCAVYASIRYTLGEVMASLAMIESPSSVLVAEYRPVEYRDDESDGPMNKTAVVDEEVTVVQEKPITSSIRGTIRHLGRVGGFRARWRGLGVSIIYNISQGLVAQVLRGIFSVIPVLGRTAVPFFLASVASTVILSRLHMTWTHIIISAPSPLPWYRRIPRGPTYFKALITPAAIFAIAEYLTLVLPLMVNSSFGAIPLIDGPKQLTGSDLRTEAWRLVATCVSAAFVALALLLPASVTLTRVEASLLPDDAETIVSFDRTLGGAAASLVGFGKVNFRALYDAAWRSFDKSSRIRLVKFYLKYFAVLAMIVGIFAVIMGAEIIAIGSSKLTVLVGSASAQMQLTQGQQIGV